MADFDVLIAGAGSAGCATALSLADFAPGLRVGLIDACAAGEPRVGDTVPPPIKPLLVHLGLWDAFSRGGHAPSYRTMAAWGSPQLGGNEFLLHAHHLGWRLDRAAFDRMLVDGASARAAACIKAKVVALAGDGDGWRVSLSDGSTHQARFAVDATGNAAALARQCGLAPVSLDRLVGSGLRVGSRSDGTEGLMIETFPEGWWYTAALPGGGRMVACMTDSDRVRSLDLSCTDGFARLLAETIHVRRVTDLDGGAGQPLIWPASSRFFDITVNSLLSVGDAGLRYDPVSGQGIVNALRTGIFASYAIADRLCRGDDRGLSRYRLMLQGAFAAYQDTLRDFYAKEQRWTDSPFWRRRHNGLPLAG